MSLHICLQLLAAVLVILLTIPRSEAVPVEPTTNFLHSPAFVVSHHWPPRDAPTYSMAMLHYGENNLCHFVTR